MSHSTRGAPIEGGHGRGPRHDVVPAWRTTRKVGRFGRLWPEMTQPLEPPNAALEALGLAMMDSAATPSIDNANIPAGYTYLGQFIDHDITLDTTSLTEVATDPNALENFRTPRLDLDSVYGLGPKVQPSLYDRDSPGRAKLLVGRTSVGGAEPDFADLPHDLPRNHQGAALIGDERNDENLLVAQTHVSFLRFHNTMVDRLSARGVADGALFERARRASVDLYQAMVLRDFLGKLCDVNDIAAAVANRRFYRFERFGAYGPFMPIEFSVAAYRLGHSMVRQDYSHNRIFRPNNAPLPSGTFDLLFLFTGKSGQIGRPGGGPANKPTLPGDWIIDWRRFLDFGTTDSADGFGLNLSRGIDPFLASALHKLPVNGVSPASPSAATSLAVMNLKRGRKMQLPAAQDLAEFMQVAPLSPDQVASGADGAVARAHGLHTRTPLWYYILKEAAVTQGGNRLGPLGSLIVAEVFVGLLQGDPTSILGRNPGWRFGQPIPGLEIEGADVSFTFADLVAIGAGGTSKPQLSPIG